MGITGREFSVGQILNSAAERVQVPPHQRPYSWETSELKELWQDLLTFDEKYPSQHIAGRQYFLGSVVGQTDASRGTFEVLDGQQRLATLTIILAAIRDVLHDEGRPDLAQKVHVNSIATSARSLDAPDEYVVRLSSLDDAYFRNVVLAYPPVEQKALPPKTASQAAILRAKKYFRLAISERSHHSSSTPVDVAMRLHTIITSHLTVIRVSSESFDDVTDVFERLNDRGKGLSTLDLLRVYLIGRTSASSRADVEEAWSSVYELSQSATKVDAFLRHSWITYRGDVKSRSLYKEIKGVLDAANQPAPLNNTLAFSQSLATDAELYRALLEAKHNDDRCAYWLRAIGTLGATSLLPAALAGVARPLPTDEYAELLKRLVTAFVRWNVIASGESTTLEEAAFAVARQIRIGSDMHAATKLFLEPLLRTDAALTEAFSVLAPSRAGYQRYLLEAIEDKLANPNSQFPVEKPVAGSGTLWIEHIYPQSPAQHWGKWEQHDEYLNRIGNLTLIHKKLNVTAKNKDLLGKKPVYAESKLELNKYFTPLTSWSPTAIEDRQRELAKLVPSVWPMF